jgi:hypothetical protein
MNQKDVERRMGETFISDFDTREDILRTWYRDVLHGDPWKLMTYDMLEKLWAERRGEVSHASQ